LARLTSDPDLRQTKLNTQATVICHVRTVGPLRERKRETEKERLREVETGSTNSDNSNEKGKMLGVPAGIPS